MRKFLFQTGAEPATEPAVPAAVVGRRHLPPALPPAAGAPRDAGLPAEAGAHRAQLPLLTLLPVQVPHRQAVPAPVLLEVPQHRPHPAGRRPHCHAGLFRR